MHIAIDKFNDRLGLAKERHFKDDSSIAVKHTAAASKRIDVLTSIVSPDTVQANDRHSAVLRQVRQFLVFGFTTTDHIKVAAMGHMSHVQKRRIVKHVTAQEERHVARILADLGPVYRESLVRRPRQSISWKHNAIYIGSLSAVKSGLHRLHIRQDIARQNFHLYHIKFHFNILCTRK